jgi:ATP-dependent DNA helicase PIF1
MEQIGDTSTEQLAQKAERDVVALSALANSMTRAEWEAYASTLPVESASAVECAAKSARRTWHQEVVDSLTQTQRDAYEAVVEKGESIFVTGPAGNGKTFLLRAMVEGLQLKENPTVRVKVTATTASAALNLEMNACTLHSFARLGLGDKPVGEYMRNRTTTKKIREAWNEVDVLFVDEVSMLDACYFEKLGEIARLVRRNSRGRKRGADGHDLGPATDAFAGLQVVLTGDFYQLPPVFKGVRDPSKPKYIFQTELWKACLDRSFLLREPQRQRDDPAFAKTLDRVRIGALTEADKNFFRSRVLGFGAKLPEDVTRIRALRADVQAINSAALARLPGKPVELVARCGLIVPPVRKDAWIEDRVKKMAESAPVDERLLLKIGSRVLLVANLNPALGLVKGSRGVVVGFKPWCSVSSGCSSTKLHKHRKSGGTKRHLDHETCPVVRFNSTVKSGSSSSSSDASGTEIVVPRWVWETEIPDVGDFYYEHFPLLGADAITCHRAQGMTLPCVELGMEKIFDSGQAYVGLGRTPVSDTLFLTCFSESAIRVDPIVHEFYASLA